MTLGPLERPPFPLNERKPTRETARTTVDRPWDKYDDWDLALPLMFSAGGALCFWIAVLVPTMKAHLVGGFSCAALTAIACSLGYLHFSEREAKS